VAPRATPGCQKAPQSPRKDVTKLSRQDPPTVLIVDDDLGVRETLAMLLEMEDYATVSAEHGMAALDCLQHGALPCLILLDLVMPVMNGWKFREAQQYDPFLEFIPVVVLSADAHVKANAEAMGVAGFLTKPVDVPALLELVRSH
jgi:CheY-like chemotaxis protein